MRWSSVSLVIAFTACAGGDSDGSQREAKARVAIAPPTPATGAPSLPRISVSSDPSAEYLLVELSGPKNARVIVSKRIGSSGTSYAKRLVDCSSMTFKYLGEGSTLEALRSSRPDDRMGDLVDGSISYFVAVAARRAFDGQGP
jgi:hypothetical protein